MRKIVAAKKQILMPGLLFIDQSFDLVLQSAALAPVPDEKEKCNMGTKMLRILKLDGIILWYYFWPNPTNQERRGNRSVDMRRLFLYRWYGFNKIKLAPPTARRLVVVSGGWHCT